jgi:monomeric isocitrate dehydrogenase
MKQFVRQMTHNQKRWFSLGVALMLFASFSHLTGCSDKAAEEVAARQKAQDDAMQQLLKQNGAAGRPDGGHTVRKPGESGMKGY